MSEDWPVLQAADSGEKLSRGMCWSETKRQYWKGEEGESKQPRGLRSMVWDVEGLEGRQDFWQVADMLCGELS